MLRVNERYGPVLQGEGASLGKPVLFLRMAGCNLHCKWCDTSASWFYEGVKFPHDYAKQVKIEDEVHEQTVSEIAEWINSQPTQRVVLSGGEPMLQQTGLVELMQACPTKLFEVETNGTFSPSDDFLGLIHQINISPKLENSGNIIQLRRRENILRNYASSPIVYFKFVVDSEADMKEVLELVDKMGIEKSRTYLMPLGHEKENQTEAMKRVEKLCLTHGFNLSPRLHVLMHGYQRGI